MVGVSPVAREAAVARHHALRGRGEDALAKELVTDPGLLLVDEPSAGLSPKITEQVYARLLQARAAGATILLVDQNIAKAIAVADYLYMIEMGRVRHHGPRAVFAEQVRDLVRDALLGV